MVRWYRMRSDVFHRPLEPETLTNGNPQQQTEPKPSPANEKIVAKPGPGQRPEPEPEPADNTTTACRNEKSKVEVPNVVQLRVLGGIKLKKIVQFNDLPGCCHRAGPEGPAPSPSTSPTTAVASGRTPLPEGPRLRERSLHPSEFIPSFQSRHYYSRSKHRASRVSQVSIKRSST